MRAAAVCAAFSAANLLTRLMIYRGLVVTMQTLDKQLLVGDSGRFLQTSELKRFAQNPENDLDPHFLRAAISRGDQCYAFAQGDVLSSYGWYAMYSPAVIGDTKVHFSSAYAFRYKGFTHPHFRGHNLPSIGQARALEALAHDGKQGLLTYVGFDDFDRLSKRLKAGYRLFGHALRLELGSRFLTLATSGCRAFRFRIASAMDAPAGIRIAERGTIDLDPRTK